MDRLNKVLLALIIIATTAFVGIRIYEKLVLAPEGMTYIAPIAGERYHSRKNCKGLRKAARIELITITEAQERGLTPCSYCG